MSDPMAGDPIATPTAPGFEGLLSGQRFLVEYQDGEADLVIRMSLEDVARLRRLGLIPASPWDTATSAPRSRRARELGLTVITPEA